MCRTRQAGSEKDPKWSDSTARQAFETLQRLMLKILEGRLNTAINAVENPNGVVVAPFEKS